MFNDGNPDHQTARDTNNYDWVLSSRVGMERMSFTPQKTLVIFGLGGHAKVVYNVLVQQKSYRVTGFLVDDRFLPEWPEFFGLPVYPLSRYRSGEVERAEYFFPAIGDNDLRQKKCQELATAGLKPALAIHPHSSVGLGSTFGPSTLVCSNVMVDPDVEVGQGVILNAKSGVGHESSIGDFVHVSAAAIIGARCALGHGSVVGMGATVISGVHIGQHVFVGAGALVTKDVPDGVLALGAPARTRRKMP